MAMMQALKSISPVDGRYRAQTEELALYFSEFALIRYRVLVEVEYFIRLCELPLEQLSSFDKSLYPALRDLYLEFTLEDARDIKDSEKITNHDVKAVEYFLRKKFKEMKIENFTEFIHFGLTSQDINNTAIPYSFKNAMQWVYFPQLSNLTSKLEKLVSGLEGYSYARQNSRTACLSDKIRQRVPGLY